ncbi:Slam-dependent surface lipoprotein [Neisseria sp. 23W00296]|uniref:Slam-dependent surface lipoprotein n=1 Tax=Neisseria sp. 23W00296 TaxID=3373603 RepID=UPI00383B6313
MARTYKTDANGVVKFGQAHDKKEPSDHKETGGLLKMAKAGNSDVYFGEWSHTGTAKDGSLNVFYVGQERASNLPELGTVKYHVRGMNNYSGDNMLTGVLNAADFGLDMIYGTIANKDLSVKITALMNRDNASFEGNANARGKLAGEKVVQGISAGQFFGNGASALAGIATFGSRRDLDTAFGGTKQP